MSDRKGIKLSLAASLLFAATTCAGNASLSNQEIISADTACPEPSTNPEKWRAIVETENFAGSGLLELVIQPSKDGTFAIQLIGQDRFAASPLNRATGRCEGGAIVGQFDALFSSVIGPVSAPVRFELHNDSDNALSLLLVAEQKSKMLKFAPAASEVFKVYDSPRLDAQGSPVTTYSYRLPDRSDDLPTGDAVAAGLEVRILEQLVEAFLTDPDFYRPASLLLMVNGELVLEEYFHGETAEAMHQTMSDTKSVVGLLYGIGLEERELPPPDTSAANFIIRQFPESSSAEWQANSNILIADLLRMSDIYGWGEDDWGNVGLDDPRRQSGQPPFASWAFANARSPDWLGYALEQPIQPSPGPYLNYNSLVTQVLAESMRRALDCASLEHYLGEKLFSPMGIQRYHWSPVWGQPTDQVCADASDPMVVAFGGLHMRPRDMVKLGQLILNKGLWDGRQLVPEDWIIQSTRVHSVPHPIRHAQDRTFGYGYQWWLQPFRKLSGERDTWAISAEGIGGQFIIAVPQYRAVLVTTGLHYTKDTDEDRLLADYILPALSGNPQARFEPVEVDRSYLGRSAFE